MSSISLSSTASYTDFNHLAELRAEAKNQTPESKREVAEQFEALFLQMMIKSMRDASGTDDSYLGGKDSELYWDMYNKQIAMDLSASGGIGMADVIYRQLGGEPLQRSAHGEFNAIPSRLDPIPVLSKRTTDIALKADSVQTNKQISWNSPDEFVSSLYSAAKNAAEQLRTEPEAILSIAALETGWGRSVAQNSNGVNSFNLFGIKATSGWQGAKVASSTLEFEQGAMVRKKELFRAYGSPQESIKDFVSFIKENPRYQAITEKSNDAVTFFKNLKSAGYATDPEYDKKLLSVLNSDVLQQAVTPFKNIVL